MKINKRLKSPCGLQKIKPGKRITKCASSEPGKKKWVRFLLSTEICSEMLDIAKKKGMSMNQTGTWLIENAILVSAYNFYKEKEKRYH